MKHTDGAITLAYAKRHASFWPWHILYLRPEPHGHWAFLPVPGKVRPSAHGECNSALFGRLVAGTLPSAWLIGCMPTMPFSFFCSSASSSMVVFSALSSVSGSAGADSPVAAASPSDPLRPRRRSRPHPHRIRSPRPRSWPRVRCPRGTAAGWFPP